MAQETRSDFVIQGLKRKINTHSCISAGAIVLLLLNQLEYFRNRIVFLDGHFFSITKAATAEARAAAFPHPLELELEESVRPFALGLVLELLVTVNINEEETPANIGFSKEISIEVAV